MVLQFLGLLESSVIRYLCCSSWNVLHPMSIYCLTNAIMSIQNDVQSPDSGSSWYPLTSVTFCSDVRKSGLFPFLMLYPVGWLLSGWKSELGYSAHSCEKAATRSLLLRLTAKHNLHETELSSIWRVLLSFPVAVGFFVLFQRVGALQAVLWNNSLFLLWTKHGVLSPWPEALHLMLPTDQ